VFGYGLEGFEEAEGFEDGAPDGEVVECDLDLFINSCAWSLLDL
jgi:hypothetical protein